MLRRTALRVFGRGSWLPQSRAPSDLGLSLKGRKRLWSIQRATLCTRAISSIKRR